MPSGIEGISLLLLKCVYQPRAIMSALMKLFARMNWYAPDIQLLEIYALPNFLIRFKKIK